MKYHAPVGMMERLNRMNYSYPGKKICDGIGYSLLFTLILTSIFDELNIKRLFQGKNFLENITIQDNSARVEEDRWKEFQEKQYAEWEKQCETHLE